MVVLQDLSEQLDPLETAYADVRFFDVDVEQTQQECETLMSEMNDELDEENVLSDQEKQVVDEMSRIENKLISKPTLEDVEEVIVLNVYYNLCVCLFVLSFFFVFLFVIK